jgi:succinate dehydrogenase / fumarate reductase cytochrome b subunit
MSWVKQTFTSTIGRKVIMSLTGLFLVSFLFVHLSGNLLMFKDDNGLAFNTYSHFMSTAFIIRILEIVLVLGFVLHIYTSYQLTQLNKKARPVGYVAGDATPQVSWFSKNMGLSGSIVLIFLITHLQNFWYRYKFQDIPMTELADGTEVKDMYVLVTTVFANEWWFSILYIVAMILLAFHLNHGFQSAFRTLGIEHKKYTPAIKNLGTLLSVVLPAGFAIFPIYYWLIAR